MALLKQVWALPVIALVAALAALCRSVGQCALLSAGAPLHSNWDAAPRRSLLAFNSCATIHINKMPPYCERVYSLPTPEPALGSDYPEAIAKMGWQVVSRYSGTGYDWYARKPMKIEVLCLSVRMCGVWTNRFGVGSADNEWKSH